MSTELLQKARKLQQADHVVLLCPLTADTRGIIGEKELYLGGFLKDFFRKFSGRPNGKYAILMDIVKYEVVHMKI